MHDFYLSPNKEHIVKARKGRLKNHRQETRLRCLHIKRKQRTVDSREKNARNTNGAKGSDRRFLPTRYINHSAINSTLSMI